MDDSEDVHQKLPTFRVQNAIDKIAKQYGFVDFQTTVTPGANLSPSDNFTGDLYRIVIDGTLNSGVQTSLPLFCKLPPRNEAKRNQCKVRDCFLREIKIFKQILPQFRQLQHEKNITEDPFNSFIDCYETSNVELEEFIITEDLRAKDYLMFDRRQNVDFEHVKIMMQELGKFHAFSFAMRDQKPEIFETYKGLNEIFVKDGEDAPPESRNYFVQLFNKARGTLEVNEIECLESFQKFEEIFHKFDLSTRGDAVEPYAVITHGDCWTNNMLFQYKDGKPYKVTFIDWQLSRYTSPVLDLMYYIFSCTDKSVRDGHYDKILKTYYHSLGYFLRRLGSDVEELYPYSVFQEQLKHLGHTGLTLAIMTMSNFVNGPDEHGTVEERKESDNKYKERMSDVIKDMVKLGYI